MVVRLVECQLERMASCGNEVAQYRIKWFVPLYDWLDSLKWRPCLYR